jgi:hypothetical protein
MNGENSQSSQKCSKISVLSQKLLGSKINNRWILGKLIDQGIFAKVYKCIDLNDKSLPLAIKI